MSLDHIRTVRLARRKPAIVMVVVGDLQLLPHDDFGFVFVGAQDRPQAMDWRPMLGLPVVVFSMQPLPELVLEVLDALQGVKAELVGYADASSVIAGHDAMKRPLRRAWEQLCRC